MPAGKRIDWIDIAKGIGIVLMIVGHTFLNESLARKVIFSFHMPLFFILAGYTFRVKDNRELVQSSAKRLLVPYVLVYWSMQILRFVKLETFDMHEALMSFSGFVFASGTEIYGYGIPPAGVIWFLVALFCARVTMNVVMGQCEKRGVPQWAQLLFWVLFAVLGVAINRKLPLSYDVAMVACLFMYIGYLAKQFDLERWMSKWWTFPIALCVWILCMQFSYLELAARIYDIAPFSIIGACAGSFLAYQLAFLIDRKGAAIKKPLIWLGVNSMLLLCIHAYDGAFVPWTALPIVAELPVPFFAAGCLRALFDVLFALVVKKV